MYWSESPIVMAAGATVITPYVFIGGSSVKRPAATRHFGGRRAEAGNERYE